MASAQPAAAGQATSTSHPYTCNTCQVAYRNIDLQKAHMKSDWHRYNLKRRVASLPPIASEVFTEKVLQARAETTAEADKAFFERSCEACTKTYYSENAYRNHLLSQKHKQNQANPPKRNDDETTSVISSTFSLGEPTPASAEEVDSDAEDEFNQVVEGLQNAKVADQRPSPVKRPTNPHPVPEGEPQDEESASTTTAQTGSNPVWTLSSCVFCNYESPSPSLNAHHMERFHGMFVPEKTYLVDLDGLIEHLQRKVSKDNQCLGCGKFKNSLFAVQTHMKDKGHCKIPYTTEDEQLDIGNFYDFRSTYSDDEDSESESTEDGTSGGAKLGARREPKATGADGEKTEDVEDAEGWETDSSASSLDSADLTAVPAEGHIHQFERLSKHPHHSSTDPRHHRQADGFHSRAHKHTHAAFYDEYELHLPSGKSVGHRSLNKYFRQNLHNYPTPEERAEQLAIEAAAQEDAEANGEDQIEVTRGRGRGREVIPRGAAGMTGVTEENRRVVDKAAERGRNLEQYKTKKTDWSYSKKLNNQKTYYYRYDGGG
ncbi:Cytoplasmic 60S subunit biogenesis factor REI1-like protein [Cladobotryum mycophilum]|uniref:Cytoplasmic 60S subunit biogenesis factor REI1-like protein n=1 Tax=Cladobotryum mycophilum TaxID=491253 RepID=A0ABR0SXU5_9HYPO